jgi:hypothetical protein
VTASVTPGGRCRNRLRCGTVARPPDRGRDSVSCLTPKTPPSTSATKRSTHGRKPHCSAGCSARNAGRRTAPSSVRTKTWRRLGVQIDEGPVRVDACAVTTPVRSRAKQQRRALTHPQRLSRGICRRMERRSPAARPALVGGVRAVEQYPAEIRF